MIIDKIIYIWYEKRRKWENILKKTIYKVLPLDNFNFFSTNGYFYIIEYDTEKILEVKSTRRLTKIEKDNQFTI